MTTKKVFGSFWGSLGQQLGIIDMLLHVFTETLSVKDPQDTSELELGIRAQSTDSPLLLCASGHGCSYHLYQGPDRSSKLS